MRYLLTKKDRLPEEGDGKGPIGRMSDADDALYGE
jgi:hypothetical protein